MASICVKEREIGNYYICMESVLNYDTAIWQVCLCEGYSDCDLCRTISEMTYSYEDKKNAIATFNRYVRKAKEMTA